MNYFKEFFMHNIIKKFAIKGNVIYCNRFGSGHINKTYDVKTDFPRRYILQRINDDIFKDIPMLMNNINLVTNHLRSVKEKGQKVLTLIPTLDGSTFYVDEHGNNWRIWKFIDKSVCLNKAESINDFYQSALAFGNFQNQMSSFDAHLLGETIPQFHDTPMRYKQLHQAIKFDTCDRVKTALPEIEFALDREDEAGIMINMQREGKLPLRVTHNDTKLNNVMLDKKTRKPLCVIDLDCVMPGLLGNDFGDSIRFGASTAEEDEQNLDNVSLSLELFEGYVRGFMEACKHSITQEEIETLPLAAKLMTLECGVRFLTDHLNGDKYFHITRKGHNLDRARTQFKLVADMENKYLDMKEIIEKYI